MWLNAPAPKPPGEAAKTTQIADSVKTAAPAATARIDTVVQRADQLGALFGARVHGKDRLITIETDLFRAELTAKRRTDQVLEDEVLQDLGRTTGRTCQSSRGRFQSALFNGGRQSAEYTGSVF
ncbi:MAG: hypothetical protein MZV64_35540 [Ignavibacteriales bacterium]|nr:hypothetical protein [Ignavibacteriales bacterium]